jgi:hypothetical protein
MRNSFSMLKPLPRNDAATVLKIAKQIATASDAMGMTAESLLLVLNVHFSDPLMAEMAATGKAAA